MPAPKTTVPKGTLGWAWVIWHAVCVHAVCVHVCVCEKHGPCMRGAPKEAMHVIQEGSTDLGFIDGLLGQVLQCASCVILLEVLHTIRRTSP